METPTSMLRRVKHCLVTMDYCSVTTRHLRDAPTITWGNEAWATKAPVPQPIPSTPKRTEPPSETWESVKKERINRCVHEALNLLLDNVTDNVLQNHEVPPYISRLLEDGTANRLYETLSARITDEVIFDGNEDVLLQACLSDVVCHTPALKLAHDRLEHFLEISSYKSESELKTARTIMDLLFLDCVGMTAVALPERSIDEIVTALRRFSLSG